MSPKLSSRAETGLIGAVVFVASAVALGMVYATGRYAWVIGWLIGAALVAYGARALYRMAGVRSWPEVPGRVLRTELGELWVPSKGGGHTEYYPVVEFEYESSSGRFTSRRFTIAPRDYRDLHSAGLEQLLARYPVGATVDVRVCPRDHRLAVLCSEVSPRRRSQYWAAIVGGALVCGISLWAALPVAA